MRVTRRELLCGAASLGAALLGQSVFGGPKRSRRRKLRSAKPRRDVDTGPLSGAKLYADVIAYYNLGEHRTASEGDLRTSQWVLEQLRTAGLRATFQPFPLRQFSIRQTRFTVIEKPIRAFPLWFPRPTGLIDAELASFESINKPESMQGKIVLVTFPASAGAAMQEGSIHSRIILTAAKSGAMAVVAVTESPTKEIIALNSPAGAEPWPIPVVLVGQRDEAVLRAAAHSKTKASLEIDGVDNLDAG